MGRTKIYTLNLHIYPRKVWVMVQPTLEEINRYFHTRDGKDIYLSDTAVATVIPLYMKSNKCMGELIRISFPDKIRVGDIAHEALHAAIDICYDVGIDTSYNDQEPVAYLTGYIANFVNEVLNKVKQ